MRFARGSTVSFFKVIESWRANGVFDLGKLAPLFVVEFTTPRFWPQFAPPLEKVRDVVSEALIANFAHPIGFRRASPRSAFPAYNHPIYAGEI
jgi:hypothetical protein